MTWDLSDSRQQLVLELDGYEGPIDLLLALAHEQKVDLGKISILALADQYLAFVTRQRSLRLDIAADYLVMAAWLAYLKSRLLLPQPAQDEEPSAAELAAELSYRLRLLEAMQIAGTRLMALVPVNNSYVDANFKETQLGDIKPGQKVDVAIDALDGKVVEGVVSSISPASGAQFSLLPPDNATGNFTKVVQRVAVRVTFPEEVLKEVPLRPGLSVVATVHTRDPAAPKPTLLGALGLEALGAKSEKP